MALKEGHVEERKRKQAVADEIRSDGVPGVWYLIAEYDKYATARDAQTKLRMRNDDLEFAARKGSVYGRVKSK